MKKHLHIKKSHAKWALVHAAFAMLAIDMVGLFAGNPELVLAGMSMHEPLYRLGGALGLAAVYLEG